MPPVTHYHNIHIRHLPPRPCRSYPVASISYSEEWVDRSSLSNLTNAILDQWEKTQFDDSVSLPWEMELAPSATKQQDSFGQKLAGTRFSPCVAKSPVYGIAVLVEIYTATGFDGFTRAWDAEQT
jgi:hypothetical protein